MNNQWSSHWSYGVLGLSLMLCLWSCNAITGLDPLTPTTGDPTMVPDTGQNPGLPNPDAPNPDPDGGSGNGSTTDPPGDNPGDDPSTSNPVDPIPESKITAQIRNESDSRADVTLRFMAEDFVLQTAFVRVLPHHITTVTSPKVADTLEFTGIDELGLGLPPVLLEFGVDFDFETAAVYVIQAMASEETPTVPLTIALLEPSVDVSLSLGSGLLVRWTDAGHTPEAMVRIFLQPIGGGANSRVPFGDAVVAALDGLNDTLSLAVDSVTLGQYEVVAEITDGNETVSSIAPGRVEITENSTNDPPQLSLLDPAQIVNVTPGDSFLVRWVDTDDDDNAQISIWLDPDLDLNQLNGNEVLLGEGISEDGDGLDDSLVVGVPTGIAKGLYRVAGVIDDGEVKLVTWAPGRINLQSTTDPGGDGPLIFRLLEPADTIFTRVELGIPIFLEAENLPLGAEIRMALTNFPYGGSTRVEFIPDSLVLNQPTTLSLSPGILDNGAWPRQFDLQALLLTTEATELRTAPATVWIRQEVEILSVDRINFDCTPGNEPTLEERFFVGIDMTWRGGGFQEREDHQEVDFWLTTDGLIPTNGKTDARHHLILTDFESPNRIIRTRLSLRELIGFRGFSGDLDDLEGRVFVSGDHLLSIQTLTTAFGEIITQPIDLVVEICLTAPQ